MDLVFASDVMMYSLCLTCNVKINSLTLDVSTHIIRVYGTAVGNIYFALYYDS